MIKEFNLPYYLPIAGFIVSQVVLYEQPNSEFELRELSPIPLTSTVMPGVPPSSVRQIYKFQLSDDDGITEINIIFNKQTIMILY